MQINNVTGDIQSLLTIDTTQSTPENSAVNVLQIIGSGGIVLPSGSTTNQPGHSGGSNTSITPVNGTLRFNSDLGYLEYYGPATGTTSASTWLTISSSTGSGTLNAATIAGLMDVYGASSTNYYEKKANLTTDVQAIVTPTYLEGQLGTYYLPEAGGSMSGSITFGGTSGITVTGLPTPVSSTDAVNKAYVDAAVAALEIHENVDYATTTALSATYANGTNGVGATLTNSGTKAPFAIDGENPAIVGQRILVKDQADPKQNGVYVISTEGTGSVNWVLTRTSDADNSIPNSLHAGLFVFVSNGTVNGQTGWVETTVGTGTNEALVIGTNNVTFTQFSGAGTYIAGTGLTLTGNSFALSSPVSQSHGGTGITGTGTANQILGENANANGLEYKSLVTSGSGLTISNTANQIAISTAAVLSIASSGTDTTGLHIASTTTAQAVTQEITGIVNIAHGGTGISAAPSVDGSLLIGSGAGTYSLNTLSQGTGITITNAATTITIANAGVTSNLAGIGIYVNNAAGASTITNLGVISVVGDAGTATGMTLSSSFNSGTGADTLTLGGTLKSTNGGTGIPTAPSVNGQLLIGSSAGTYALSVPTGSNNITVTSTGSNLVISNTGILSLSAGSTGLTVTGSGVGNVTLGGTLNVANGGTGLATTPSSGQLLIGNGSNYTLSSLTAGTAISISNGAGTITITNQGVTSVSSSTGGTGLTLNTTNVAGAATTTTITGTLVPASGGTGLTTFTSGGAVYATSTSALTTGILPTTAGGTGLSAIGTTAYQLLTVNPAANGLAYSTLTAGTGISLTPASGSITVNNTGVTSLSVTTVAAATGSSGILVGTSSGSMTEGTFATPATATVTTNGTIYIELDNALQSLVNLSTTGMIAAGASTIVSRVMIGGGQTATGSATGVTNSASSSVSNTILVTDGDGIANNPTFDLKAVTQGSTVAAWNKMATNGYGQVTNTTAVVQSDLTGLLSTYYLPSTGGSVSGTITLTGGSATVTGVPTPVNATDVANKAYVDATAQGLDIHDSVEFATVAALPSNTYVNGTAGVGSTITATANGVLTVDGLTPVLNDRILVKNEATATHNGIYTVTTLGTGSIPFVLTRATDANNSIANQVHAGEFVFVGNGNTLKSSGWIQTTVGTGTNEATIIGTDSQVWSQFSGGALYSAGTGLTLTGGSVFSLTSPVAPTLGGTGTTTAPTTGQVLVGTAGNIYAPATITGGTGLTVNAGSGTLSITNTGVTSFSGGTTGLTPNTGTTGAITLAGTLAIGFGGTGLTATPSNGQLLIGNGAGFTLANLSGTVNQIGVSNTSGGITLTNLGLLSIATSTSTTGLTWTPTTSSGAVTTALSGILNIGNGGTGTSATPTQTQVLLGNVSNGYTLTTLAAGTGISIPVTTGPDVLTIKNTGVTSFNTDLSGLTPTSSSTGAITLSGVLGHANGGTGLPTIGTAYQVLGSSGSALEYLTIAGTPSQIGVATAGTTITLSNLGLLSIASSTGSTGLSVAFTTSSGAVTTALSGTVVTSAGGTGLTSIGSANQLLGSTGSVLEYFTLAAGTGLSLDTSVAGTLTFNNTGVTSVALSAPSIFTVSGSPVTTTGTLSFALNTQAAKAVFIGPVSGSAAAPTFRALATTDLPIYLYAEHTSLTATNNTVSGTNAVAIGTNNTASAANAIALGNEANASRPGAISTANGYFAAAGDAQTSFYTLRNSTTNATATELFTDGSSGLIDLPVNALFGYTINLIGLSSADQVMYKFDGAIYKGGASSTTTIVGQQVTTIAETAGAFSAGWAASVTADVTNGALKVTVTGAASTTIQWVATVTTTETHF